VGQRIKGIRLNDRVTQRQFAAQMKMSNTHLSDIETGRFLPGFHFFYRIAKYHNVNPLYLIFGKEPIFLKEEKEKDKQTVKETPEPPAQAPPKPETPAPGEYTPQVQEMLSYFQRSPVVKFAVLGYFSKFIVENKAVIEQDIKMHETEPTTETENEKQD
jgi:transcriptional regulator with XRE-family HTH domain